MPQYLDDLDTAIDAWETTNARFDGLTLTKASSPEEDLLKGAVISAERVARLEVIRQAENAFVTDGGSLNMRHTHYLASTAVRWFRKTNKDFSARNLLDVMKAVRVHDENSQELITLQPTWNENIKRLVAAA